MSSPEPPPDDPAHPQVKALCDALNDHGVQYVLFGSFAGLLQGVPLRTVDIDIVPEASQANLQRLCDALNSLEPRWRVDDLSAGLKIDGGKLEPRHILGSSIALGLVTKAGMVDIVLEPKGFEGGFRDLTGSAIGVEVDGTRVRVGTLAALIASKHLLNREKDREHLPLLQRRVAELAAEIRERREERGPRGPGREPDGGIDLGR
ncbi:MAG: hypothetical protein ACYCTI_01805 [Acidimicrobiales bacterium]